MNSERIQEIHEETAYPESHSVQQALFKVWNECEQEKLCLDAKFWNAEQLAEQFHTLYEKFAPEYGYETRGESAVKWKDVPEQNKKLMIRVCSEIYGGE